MQGSYVNIIMIVFLFGFMYFMIIRPQSKRNKELKLLQDSLRRYRRSRDSNSKSKNCTESRNRNRS